MILWDMFGVQRGQLLVLNWSGLHTFGKKVMIFLTVCYIRPDFEDLKSQLVGLGANYVVTEEELKSSEMKKTMKVSSVFSTWLSMATKIVTAWSTVLAREAKPFSHIHCINRSALSNILIQARIIDCKCVPHSPTLFRILWL